MVILQTHAIQFEYDKYRGFNFPDILLNAGDKLLITGRSGTGKSTFLNLLGGILRPSKGHINLLGSNYVDLNTRQLDVLRANKIGLIFQALNLIPYLTALQNAKFGIRFSLERQKKINDPKREIHRLATVFGLQDSLLDQTVNKLSIGQQQRIALIRAMLGNPPLILADEPTSALDPVSAKQFLDELTTNLDKKKQALIMVSHNPSLYSYFDQIIELRS